MRLYLQEQLNALTPATQRQYSRVWHEWSQWCRSNHHSRVLPPEVDQHSPLLLAYGKFLFQRQRQPNTAGTILAKISALNWYHKAAFNRPVGLTDQHRITIEGMARQRSVDKRSQPISPAILAAYYAATPTRSSSKAIATWGCLVLAFFFCMRSCEYSKTPNDPDHFIRRQDVTFTDKHGQLATSAREAHSVHIFFRSSKSDNRKRGCARTLTRTSHGQLCPVIAAWSLQDEARDLGIPPEGPLCSFKDRAGSIRQVASSAITNAVKRAVKLYGVDPNRYSSHSLRSGGATAMFLGGSSDATVQLFGRWTSDAYKAYVRIETSTNEKLSQKMIKSLGGINSFTPYRTL